MNLPSRAWPYVTAITFAGLAIVSSIAVSPDRATPVLTLIGTLAGYVLATHREATPESVLKPEAVGGPT